LDQERKPTIFNAQKKHNHKNLIFDLKTTNNSSLKLPLKKKQLQLHSLMATHPIITLHRGREKLESCTQGTPVFCHGFPSPDHQRHQR